MDLHRSLWRQSWAKEGASPRPQMVQPTVCGHLRQPSGAPQTFPMAFCCAVFGLWGCPPGKPSVAEGLARKHRDMPGFATSVLNLLAFSFYFWAGGAALQRWVSVQQVPCSFCHFSKPGSCSGWPACCITPGGGVWPSHHITSCAWLLLSCSTRC